MCTCIVKPSLFLFFFSLSAKAEHSLLRFSSTETCISFLLSRVPRASRRVSLPEGVRMEFDRNAVSTDTPRGDRGSVAGRANTVEIETFVGTGTGTRCYPAGNRSVTRAEQLVAVKTDTMRTPDASSPGVKETGSGFIDAYGARPFSLKERSFCPRDRLTGCFRALVCRLCSLAEGLKRKLNSFTKVGSIGYSFLRHVWSCFNSIRVPRFHFLNDREL